MSQKITVEKRGHVLMIGINRDDKLNAIDPEMITSLSEAYTRLHKDPDLRCGVLWAEGRYFTSGLDLAKVVAALPRELTSPMVPRRKINPFGTFGRTCKKPIVSAVDGPCFTAGLELILASQIIVASKNASFIQNEISRGIFPFGGATVRWPLAVGAHNANRYLLTADELTAEEAHRIGLVQELVEPGEALVRALAIAETIAKQAPLGVEATLQSVRRLQAKGAKAAFNRLKMKFFRLLISKDARRGVDAFKARKEAKFMGN